MITKKSRPKSNYTLRQLLQKVNLTRVYQYINAKDQGNAAPCDRPTLDQTIFAYTGVIKELLGKPLTEPYKLSWLAREERDFFDKKLYIHICLLNHNYVAPPKKLKAWHGKNPPEGHYNANLDKYTKIYAAGWEPWSKMIDTPVINKTKHSWVRVIAEVLWELTFYGWTEEKVAEHVRMMKGRINTSVKQSDIDQANKKS